jgi:hypothetical protein
MGTFPKRALRFQARIVPSAEEPTVSRFMITVVLVAIFTGAVVASDPGSGRAMRQFKPRPHGRQIGVREDDFVGLVGVLPAQPVHERLIEWAVCPAAPVIRLVKSWWSDPPVVVVDR